MSYHFHDMNKIRCSKFVKSQFDARYFVFGNLIWWYNLIPFRYFNKNDMRHPNTNVSTQILKIHMHTNIHYHIILTWNPTASHGCNHRHFLCLLSLVFLFQCLFHVMFIARSFRFTHFMLCMRNAALFFLRLLWMKVKYCVEACSLEVSTQSIKANKLELICLYEPVWNQCATVLLPSSLDFFYLFFALTHSSF